MKMTPQRSMGHQLIEAVNRMAATRLALELQDNTVIKVDLSGADLRLHLADGRVILISAVEHNITGKPSLEFEVSPDPLTLPKVVV